MEPVAAGAKADPRLRDALGNGAVRAGLFVFGTVTFVLMFLATPASAVDPAEELLFYRDDGTFAYYNVSRTGSLGTPIRSGTGYQDDWDVITPVDMDGDGQDEMLFYKKNGTYAYYNVSPSGALGASFRTGTGYIKNWDVITSVDLNGQGQDELLFYNNNGAFAYYNIKPDGSLGTAIRSGSGYLDNWHVIAAVDINSDASDELLFYDQNGAFAYYNVTSTGVLGSSFRSGTGYRDDWDVITPVDVEGDGKDELLFYDENGTFAWYNVTSSGRLGSPFRSGTGYYKNWDIIAHADLERDAPIEMVSRFTTHFDCCLPRVTNIKQMAADVDGYTIMPGETFSIDRVVGPRTTAGGYVPAPYMVGGQGECCAVGGGVSQFGTTMFNAAFWGGFPIVDHQPHSGWISRYPLGIEATLVYKSIDLKFTNNTLNPLTIQTYSSSTSVTVELWGFQGGWQVAGRHPTGSRSSHLTVLDYGGEAAARVSASVTGSAPGTVKVVRVLKLDGSVTPKTWFWTYVS
jgi:hypothetical protein